MNKELPGNGKHVEAQEEINFQVLRPGDIQITHSLTGEEIRVEISSNQRVIALGEDTGMSLEEYGEYFFIDGVHVAESLRGQGIASKLYDKALDLAKEEGKKGLISKSGKRNEGSDHIWEKFKREGRTDTVEIDGDKYDVLRN